MTRAHRQKNFLKVPLSLVVLLTCQELIYNLGLVHAQNPTPSHPPTLCQREVARGPELAFTLATFRPGEMRQKCEIQLDLALAAGFTSVAIIPTFIFDSGLDEMESPPRRLRAASVTPSFDATEVEECLLRSWTRGLGVIYQPHLEGSGTISGRGEQEWRAYFDFSPTPDLTQVLLAPFFNWIRRSVPSIRQAERQYLAVIPAAELEVSTATYPAAWLAALALIRQELASFSLGRRIPVGFNPNWHPHGGREIQCADYGRWVASVDTIAPSFYPNWQERFLTPANSIGSLVSPAENINRVRNLLRFQQGCEVPAYAQAELNIGEFAIGPLLSFPSADSDLPGIESPYYSARRELFRRMLDWARQTRLQHPLTIWTVGIFDAIGVGLDSRAVVDPQIVEDLRAYSRSICPRLTLPSLRIWGGATRLPSAAAQSSVGNCRPPPAVLSETVRNHLESLVVAVRPKSAFPSRK